MTKLEIYRECMATLTFENQSIQSTTLTGKKKETT